MTNLTFTPDMIDLLRTFKSAQLLSYECVETYNCIYGNLRINTSQGAIELTNLERTTPFFDDEEELSCFECTSVAPATPFKPLINDSTVTHPICEKIVGIDLIRDYVTVNDGEYELLFDQAVVFHTETKTVMFSRHVWFSEDIMVSDNNDYDTLFPIEEVIDTLSNEGEYKVRVSRTIEVL